MSLPAFQILTPTFVDTLQYPTGALVGVNAGTDKWEVDTTGMLSDYRCASYIQHDPTDANYDNYSGISGGPCNAAAKVPIGFSVNHWVAAQCILALDNGSASFPAARMNLDTGDCYYISYREDTEYSFTRVALTVRKNGSMTPLITIDFEGDGVIVDGYQVSDGPLLMMEVVGANPVNLRLAIMLPRTALRSAGHIIGPGNGKFITTLPNEVSPGYTMPYGYLVVGEYAHSGASQVLTGRPGIVAGGLNYAGGIYGFNAGELLGPGLHHMSQSGSPLTGMSKTGSPLTGMSN